MRLLSRFILCVLGQQAIYPGVPVYPSRLLRAGQRIEPSHCSMLIFRRATRSMRARTTLSQQLVQPHCVERRPAQRLAPGCCHAVSRRPASDDTSPTRIGSPLAQRYSGSHHRHYAWYRAWCVFLTPMALQPALVQRSARQAAAPDHKWQTARAIRRLRTLVVEADGHHSLPPPPRAPLPFPHRRNVHWQFGIVARKLGEHQTARRWILVLKPPWLRRPSKHRVVVRRGLGHGLKDIPMFDNLAVL
jgi:hypothetical protein